MDSTRSGSVWARKRKLLAEASLISEGPAQNLSPSVKHGKAEDSVPASKGLSTHDWMVALFERAERSGRLTEACERAEEELARIRGQFEKPKLPPEKARVLMFRGVTAEATAVCLYTSEKLVRRWRREFNVDEEYGFAETERKAA